MSQFSKDFISAFEAQYPKYTLVKNDKALEFSAEGSNYRVYLPTGKIHPDSLDLTIQIDHILGGSPDDHATIKISFDENGQYVVPPTVSYNMSDGTQIPDWVCSAVDGTLGIGSTIISIVVGLVSSAFLTPVGGAAVGIVTEGVLLIISIGVSAGMDLFNYIENRVKDMSDDGGSLYLSEIVTHTWIRTTTAALVAQEGAFEQGIGFDYDEFLSQMNQNTWDDKNGNAIKYHDDDSNHYRTWKPDYSVNYQNIGVFVSCKIDGIRDNHTDDHVLIGCLYDPACNLTSVQVTVRMLNETTLDIGSVMYQDGSLVNITSSGISTLSSSYNSISDAVRALIDANLNAYSNYSNFPNERKNLPTITKNNIDAMSNSVKLTS
jgi:hypothetical protein